MNGHDGDLSSGEVVEAHRVQIAQGQTAQAEGEQQHQHAQSSLSRADEYHQCRCI